jgi:hypothetical protein
MSHFGVEVEAFKPRTPPYLYDSGARAPIVAALQAHMQRLPARARRLRTDDADPLSEADPSTGEPWEATPVKVGYFTYASSKSDEAFDAWKVTTDASIRGDHGEGVGGLEFITPKLPFRKSAIEAVRHFVAGVAIGGFIANETTAVHVHVSCQHLSNEQVRRLATYLVAMEQIIDVYLSPRRREDNCRYVRSNLQSVTPTRSWFDAVRRIEGVDVSESLDALVDVMNVKLAPVPHSERNHKVNFTLLRGTRQGDGRRRVEFRQHQGTTDPHAVCDWAEFCVKLVRAAAAQRESPLEAVKRSGLLDCYDKAVGSLPLEFLWRLIDDTVLEERFAWYRKAADGMGPVGATESREIVALQADAYDDMNDIDAVLRPEAAATAAAPARGRSSSASDDDRSE